MVAQDGTVNPATGGWSEALEELHRRIAGRFARSEATERVANPPYGRQEVSERSLYNRYPRSLAATDHQAPGRS
jgi:hypothetical protein